MKSGLIVIVSWSILIFNGCEKSEKPTIPQDKMIDILVDVHLAEASLLGFSEERKDSLAQVYYQQIYEIHSISEENFLAEMDYLKYHPDYLGQVYEKVIEELRKRETESN